MTRELSHKETFHKLCDDLSTDIDAELCDEVKEHIKDCPDCKIYVDTLRQTVYLYRGEQEQEEGIPAEVSDRLFKVLKLDDIREKLKEAS
ncbi:MAG TPA: hypothetical protein VKA68_17545 [bacterium]|nr:hypothetical protein [bacterium]